MDYRESRLSTPDGLQLHQRRWLPDQPPRATVVLIHGLAEHGGRYAPLAERLNAEGYAVYAVDLRGHGLSNGRRIYVDSFQQHVDDVTLFLRNVQAEQPDQPLFLFGHSMGGLIVTWLATDGVVDVCGVAVCAAALKVHDQIFPMLRWLAVPASLFLPTVGFVRLNFQKVSRDPQAVAAFEGDPLVYRGSIPNRTAGELLRAGLQLQYRTSTIQQPLLILHGTGDVITDPLGAERLYRQARTRDKTLKLYEGLYHNLLDEPEKEQVMSDLISWLNARRMK
jgi:alpha-beta hydrolase superfamily lysophospholipase